jgi:hypothetical protein
MASLSTLVERVRGRLNQYVVARPQLATFNGLVDGVMDLEPAQGYNTLGGTSLVEIGHELIQITGFDQSSNSATVPSWGRAQLGTSQATLTIGSKATINPLWPYWHVAQHLIDAMAGLYPDLFGVKNTELTSTILDERYVLPVDLEDILDIRLEWWGPIQPQRPISRYTIDLSNTDGKRYLHIPNIGVGGRPIYVSYRARPVLPTGPDDTSWTWANTLLPDSAEDLPILRAASYLIVASESVKMQNFSSEQSDRNRFIQMGSGNAVSRRMAEMYEQRLAEERRKLLDRHPIRLTRNFNR